MKKQTKLLLGLLLAILVGLALVFTFSKKDGGEKKVGVILPLSGDLSFLGEFMKNSMLLDSTDVTYIFEDCHGETKQAIMAANKLINIDKVSSIVSSLSFLSEAINPMCENAGIPHFILSFSPVLVEKKNVIQPFISTRLESEAFVKYVKENNYKTVAFLRHQEPDATYGFENIIKPQLKDSVKIIDIGFNNATIKDFKPEILKIKQANPDLLIIQSLAYNIPNIVTALKAYNITIPTLGDVNFLDIQDAQTMDLVEGIPFVGIQSVLSRKYKTFKEKYTKKYNKDPFALGSFAYDLGHYLNQVSPSIGVDSILYVLNTIKDPSLVNTQAVRFDKTGQENVVCKILTFKNKDIMEY